LRKINKMEEKILKQRDSFFDNAKLLLIILVVMGHMIEPLAGGQTLKPLYMLIYSFHMPLFILISGYFSKNYTSESYARKVITNLVLPYVIFETLYSLLDFVLSNGAPLTFTYFTP